jgi:hypothetical protein
MILGACLKRTRERVNRVRGARDNREDQGALGKFSLLPPPDPDRGGRRGARSGGRAAASRGRRRPGAGGIEGGGRGLAPTVLTLAKDGLRRCLRGKGRPAVKMGGGGANGGVAVRLSAAGSSWLWCGAARRGAGLL